MDPAAGAPSTADARTRTLCVLFFFSGSPALVYQLVWQRALFRIFGVNAESVTIVVTAFMIGLGAGSLAGGWLSRRRAPLLPLLAAIEPLTAAFGLASLRVFDAVAGLVLGASLAATAAATLALVIAPTLLMGATLPVLVGHLVRRTARVDAERWRRALRAWRIDGRPVLDPARPEGRRVLDGVPHLEPCAQILARTAGKAPVTDDNMGSEWRFVYGLE